MSRLRCTIFVLLLAVGGLIGCGSQQSADGAEQRCDAVPAAVEPDCMLASAPAWYEALESILVGRFSLARRFDYSGGGYDARAYPSEAAVVFWSAFRLTGDTAFLDAGRSQLNYARSLVDASGYFRWPYENLGQFSSNALARLALGFYVGFLVHGDRADIETADRVADALMRLEEMMVRDSKTGQYYLLPYYVYRSPAEPTGSRTLDPNQDATLALLFVLLAAETQSKHYRSAVVTERASRYLDAALALLEPGECWPVADQSGFRTACDSLYNWWTMYQLHWINEVNPQPRIDALLADQYAILRKDLLEGLSRRAYPVPDYGPMPNPTELWLSLPAAADYGKTGDVTQINLLLAEQAKQFSVWSDMPGGFIVTYGIRGQGLFP